MSRASATSTQDKNFFLQGAVDLMWCLQLCRKGVSLRQYVGKSFNFFVVWGRTWYHSAVVLFPSRGCSRGRCRSDAALSGRCPVLEELPCPVPVPVPIPLLPGRCAGLQEAGGPTGEPGLAKRSRCAPSSSCFMLPLAEDGRAAVSWRAVRALRALCWGAGGSRVVSPRPQNPQFPFSEELESIP